MQAIPPLHAPYTALSTRVYHLMRVRVCVNVRVPECSVECPLLPDLSARVRSRSLGMCVFVCACVYVCTRHGTSLVSVLQTSFIHRLQEHANTHTRTPTFIHATEDNGGWVMVHETEVREGTQVYNPGVADAADEGDGSRDNLQKATPAQCV